ncbi:MAG: hypothetical protein J6L69_06195 [Lachnospiraceae bacterium]|nr:hypothetical protein [Lachnospiraceae bacterium]
MILLAIILGIILGVSLSFGITMLVVKASNDLGDSTGSFNQFTNGTMKYLSKHKK